MYKRTIQVAYTTIDTEEIVFDTGLTYIPELDKIYIGNKSIRKHIFKVDIVPRLSEFVNAEMITSGRNILMGIANGTYDSKGLSHVIKSLMPVDSIFESAIKKMFCSCPNSAVFGKYIEQCFADKLTHARLDLSEIMRQNCTIKYLSNGYLYIAVNDDYSLLDLIKDLPYERIR